jgi:NADH dehydrogenase [ubiquinone] 1 alpha subcomplex assembly factor 7
MPGQSSTLDKPATLLDKIRQHIVEHGPMSISEYMSACLGDPAFGYYATRDPFGKAGDFTTAPEISQVFGELIGAWCAVVWQQMGQPAPVRLIELGPGRGTLMADALRAASMAEAFRSAIDVRLIETSSALRSVQEEQLARSKIKPHWHQRLEDVDPGAAIIVANEFLDALPVRQFARLDGAWHERCVHVKGDGSLEIRPSERAFENMDIIPPAITKDARDGDMAEIRPQAEEIVATMAARAESAPVAALFIDYGHDQSVPGETLQAVHAHEYSDPLTAPGDADLTAHVDFGQLGDAARDLGLHVHGPMTQGAFLLSLGLKERCEKLVAHASPEQREDITSGAQRLADPAQMGDLFKVIAMTNRGIQPPPFAG